MSPSVDLLDTRLLSDLSRSLHQFASLAVQELQASSAQASSVRNQLQSRLQVCQVQVQLAHNALHIVEASLQRCESEQRQARDRKECPPDCNDLKAGVARATQKVRKAEERYQQTRRAIEYLERAISDFHRQAIQLRDLAQTHIPRARSFLEGRLKAGESYLAVSAPSTLLPPKEVDEQ